VFHLHPFRRTGRPCCWRPPPFLCLTAPARAADATPPVKAKKPRVEVVFCLDTTGSMGGLIEAAKQKIWQISNQIASGKPVPDLKIGLVAYRDRGDVYITKVIDLSDDLDAIHGHLRGFQAQGGRRHRPRASTRPCSTPSNKIKWSTDKDTLRIIFLVGDAPPHMDYPRRLQVPRDLQEGGREGHHHQHHPVRPRRRDAQVLDRHLRQGRGLVRADRPGRAASWPWPRPSTSAWARSTPNWPNRR